MAELKGHDGTYYCGPGWGMGTAITAMILCAVSACLILLARRGESIPLTVIREAQPCLLIAALSFPEFGGKRSFSLSKDAAPAAAHGHETREQP
jgi:hypothetical protein